MEEGGTAGFPPGQLKKWLFSLQIFMDFYLSSRKKKGVSLTKESSVLLSKEEVRPVQRVDMPFFLCYHMSN